MHAAVSQSLFYEQMKNKMANEAEKFGCSKWDNCKKFIYTDMTGVSWGCNNDCLLLYGIGQQNSPVWKHCLPKSFQDVILHNIMKHLKKNAIYRRTTSFYIPR